MHLLSFFLFLIVFAMTRIILITTTMHQKRMHLPRLHHRRQMATSEEDLAEWQHLSSKQLIAPERATILRIQVCTHQMQPFLLDTMLFFPSILKFCASIDTNKPPSALIRERGRTTFFQSSVRLTYRRVDSTDECAIGFMSHAGEYRFSPDFGYYMACQRSISEHVSWLSETETQRSQEYYASNSSTLEGDTTSIKKSTGLAPAAAVFSLSCPIQSLPTTSRELKACDLSEGAWYELNMKSSIRYELINEHQMRWANHSATFVFKPENFVEQNGTEIAWLQRLFKIKINLRQGCAQIRYLFKLDDQWPADQLPVQIVIDYQVRENAYVKHFRHLGNGTLDGWFTGVFSVWRTPDPRIHELCAKFWWPKSANRYRLCRTFLHARPTSNCVGNELFFTSSSSNSMFAPSFTLFSTNFVMNVFQNVIFFLSTFLFNYFNQFCKINLFNQIKTSS